MPILRISLPLNRLAALRSTPPRPLPSAPPTLNHHRLTSPFSTLPTLAYAKKTTQDKDSIDVSSNEYTKSGSDGDAAHTDAAFDPNVTSPDAELKSGGGGSNQGDLDVSPANQEVSKPRGQQEGGAQRSENESKGDRKMSGGGSPQKNGGGTSGGGGSGSA